MRLLLGGSLMRTGDAHCKSGASLPAGARVIASAYLTEIDMARNLYQRSGGLLPS